MSSVQNRCKSTKKIDMRIFCPRIFSFFISHSLFFFVFFVFMDNHIEKKCIFAP